MVKLLVEGAKRWSEALKNRDAAALRIVVADFPKLVCTPAEIKACRGLGTATSGIAIDRLGLPDLTAKVKALRNDWIAKTKLAVEFNQLAAQLLKRSESTCKNILCEAVYILLSLGFRSALELDGARTSIWKTRNNEVKAYLNELVDAISCETLLKLQTSKIDAGLEMILNAKPVERNVLDMKGPASEIRSARMHDWSDKQREQILNDVCLETVISSLSGGLPSYRSGLRCYLLFHLECFGNRVHALPPRIEALVL